MKLNQCRNCRREGTISLMPTLGRCTACHKKREERMTDEVVQVKPVYMLKDAVKCGIEGEYYYQGYVYDNPKFEDGTYVHTSRLVAEEIGEKTGKVVSIETLNSHYDLN